jgi:hypothetical protein
VSHQLTIELSVDAPRQIRRSLDRYTERIDQTLFAHATVGLRYVELLSDRWSGGSENSFSVWLEIDTEHSLITRKR